MEQKVLQITQYMTRLTVNHHLLFTFSEVIHHRFIGIKLRTMLIEISHFQFRADMNASTVCLKLPEHQFQQGGFAAAVWANQRNFVATLYLSGKIFHQLLAVNLVANVFHFENDLTGAAGLFHLHLRRAHYLTALATFTAHRFQGAHAAFITGTACFDPLTDPHFFLRQFAIKLGIL